MISLSGLTADAGSGSGCGHLDQDAILKAVADAVLVIVSNSLLYADPWLSLVRSVDFVQVRKITLWFDVHFDRWELEISVAVGVVATHELRRGYVAGLSAGPLKADERDHGVGQVAHHVAVVFEPILELRDIPPLLKQLASDTARVRE